MKYIISIIGLLIYLLLLIATYRLYIFIFKVDVVFYSSLFSAFLAIVLYAIFLYLVPYFKILDNFNKLNNLVIASLLGYCIAISVPTVIDRSLSFYILEKLQQRGGGIQLESFEKIFTEEYMKEHRLVDVRLTEQLESGTIHIINDCVLLTSKGKNIVKFSQYFRKNWLPKQRLLMGKYSDDLTNPFRNTKENPVYTCDGK